MILTDKEIINEINKGNLIIDPFNKNSIAPNCLKLHLGTPLFLLKTNDSKVVDVKNANSYPDLIEVKADDKGGFILEQNRVYLAPTFEKVSFGDKFCGIIDGTSNLARLGISVVLSSQISCGFCLNKPGILTLEIISRAVENIRLYPKMTICNVIVFELRRKPSVKYGENPWNHSGEDFIKGSLIYKKYRK